MDTVSIYALKDPRNDEVFYIGKSIKPTLRLAQHLADRTDTPKTRRIAEIVAGGYAPFIDILEEVPAPRSSKAEAEWLIQGREQEWPLTNMVTGPVERIESEFIDWLTSELVARGWSMRELARRGRPISTSAISNTLNGYNNPGKRVCRAIARAFNLPVETVFRYANILPPEVQEDEGESRLTTIYRKLDNHHRAILLATARAILANTTTVT